MCIYLFLISIFPPWSDWSLPLPCHVAGICYWTYTTFHVFKCLSPTLNCLRIRTVSDSSLTLTDLANNWCSINLIYVFVYSGSNSLITEEITIKSAEKRTSPLQNTNVLEMSGNVWKCLERGIVHNQALNQNSEYVTFLLNTDRWKVHVVTWGIFMLYPVEAIQSSSFISADTNLKAQIWYILDTIKYH